MTTLERSENRTCQNATLFAVDSPARIYPTPGKGLASTPNAADCGANITASFVNFDPITCLWKTSQLCLDGGFQEFSETWPQAGMMRSGQCFLRAPWVRHTCEKGCSLWLTPTVFDSDKRPNSAPNNTLSFMVRFKTDNRARIGGEIPNPIDEMHLNPNFTEWLMGFPIGWTELRDAETP